MPRHHVPACPTQRRSSRRWALPAVVTRDFTEPFDGWRILSEVPGNLGLALWQAMRDAELWAWATDREGLFRPGATERRRQILEVADVPAGLTAALDVLTGLVAHPADVHPDLASMACSRVARWAEANGSLATALAFAQAAALARPERGRLAVEVGRRRSAATRRAGRPGCGERWGYAGGRWGWRRTAQRERTPARGWSWATCTAPGTSRTVRAVPTSGRSAPASGPASGSHVDGRCGDWGGSAASDAWHRAQALSAELAPSPSHALALQDLARGAAAAGESRRSFDAARRAAEMGAPETDRCTGVPAHALLNAESRPGESTPNWK